MTEPDEDKRDKDKKPYEDEDETPYQDEEEDDKNPYQKYEDEDKTPYQKYQDGEDDDKNIDYDEDENEDYDESHWLDYNPAHDDSDVAKPIESPHLQFMDISRLPRDILKYILSWTTGSTAHQVCKRWRSLAPTGSDAQCIVTLIGKMIFSKVEFAVLSFAEASFTP